MAEPDTPPKPPDSAPPHDRQELGLFLCLVGLTVLPVWLFRYFPAQDGPAHVYGVWIVLQHYLGVSDLYAQYYSFALRPDPNWIGQFILMPAMLLVSPLVAEKILLTVYLTGLPLAVRWALNGVRPGAGWLAVFSIPLAANWMLFMGFYNFLLSLIPMFLLLGWWVRRCQRLDALTALGIVALSFAVYFGHIVSLVQVWLAIGFHFVLMLIRRYLKARHDQEALDMVFKSILARLLIFSAIALPTTIMAGLYAMHQMGRKAAAGLTDSDPLFYFSTLKLKELITLRDALIGLELAERWLAPLFVLVLGLTVIAGLVIRLREPRRLRQDDLLLAFPLVWLAVYLAAPKGEDFFINPRLLLYPYLGLLPWLASLTWPHAVRWAAFAGCAVVIAAFSIIRFPAYAEADDHLAEFASVYGQIEQPATVLPLSLSDGGRDASNQPIAIRAGIFQHAAGRLLAGRQLVNLGDYQGGQTHFTQRYRPGRDPFVQIGPLGGAIGEIDILNYEAKSGGGRIDYIMIWDAENKLFEWESFASLREQLDQGYELLAISESRGQARLYRRKP